MIKKLKEIFKKYPNFNFFENILERAVDKYFENPEEKSFEIELSTKEGEIFLGNAWELVPFASNTLEDIGMEIASCGLAGEKSFHFKLK